MTVSSETTKVSYAGDGETVVFPITFTIFAKTEITVILRKASGEEYVAILDSDYTVAYDLSSITWIKGDPVVPPASDETLLITRSLPLKQETDYISGDPFPAETHERALDRLTMMAQQLKEMLDRAMLLKPTSSLSGLVLPEVASGFLRWNGTMNQIEAVQQLGTVGILEGWAPHPGGSMVNWGVSSKPVLVYGAAVGDYAVASHSAIIYDDMPGNKIAFLTANVVAENMVRVFLMNVCGTTWDRPEGTIRVIVFKKTIA